MSKLFRDYFDNIQDNWNNLSEKEKKDFQDFLDKSEEEERYEQLLKHNDSTEATADLEQLQKRIETRKDSIKKHKLNISEFLQNEGVDRVTKVSLTRSIASLHEWHENKKKKLAEKQRIAAEKRRIEEDEKVGDGGIHLNGNI